MQRSSNLTVLVNFGNLINFPEVQYQLRRVLHYYLMICLDLYCYLYFAHMVHIAR